MFERILVPLDGSKVGETALPLVEELMSKLAPGVKVEVTLLQVVSPLSHYVVGGETTAEVVYTDEEVEQIKGQAMAYLERAGEGLRSKGAIVQCKVGVGRAADVIIKEVTDEIGADLVAMSTHGRSGLSRWALGSVTDKVLRSGKVPVLVVRASAGGEKP